MAQINKRKRGKKTFSKSNKEFTDDRHYSSNRDETMDERDAKSNRSRSSNRVNSRSKGASNDMSFIYAGDSNGGNDVSWYTHIYPAWDDVSRVPFNIMTGLPYNVRDHYPGAQAPGGAVIDADAVSLDPLSNIDPGLMLIDIMPVLGNAGFANTAAQQLYTLIRKANSGATNYDQTDLMMYVLAMDSAFMMYQDLARVYSLMNAYDYLSRYSPRQIVYALGYDYDDLLSHKTQFKAKLDQFAHQLGAFCVPKQLDLLKRHSFMFSNIYEDEIDGRAQLYAFRSTGFYEWVEGADSRATHLTYQWTTEWFGEGSKRYAGIVSGINKMLRNLWGSQDIGTINGDILKAFGPSNCVQINTLDENFILTPVHNEEVMMQIQNCEMLPPDLMLLNPESSICQKLDNLNDGPRIVQTVIFDAPSQGLWNIAPLLDTEFAHLLNLESDTSGEAVITSTRLKQDAILGTAVSWSNGVAQEIYGLHLKSCGTEIVTQVTMVKVTEGATLNNLLRVPRFIDIRNYDPKDLWEMLTSLSKFRYAPNVNIVASDPEKPNHWKYYGNLQNHTKLAVIPYSLLYDLHNVCIQSEYAVLDYGKGITSR